MPENAEGEGMNENPRPVLLATDLRCIECQRGWLDASERWRMYAITGDEAVTGLYCPVCAAFEFDQ
jgi:hypothetical protein